MSITMPARPRDLTTRFPIMSAERYWSAVESEYAMVYGGDVSWSDDIRPCWEAGYSVEMAARAIRARRHPMTRVTIHDIPRMMRETAPPPKSIWQQLREWWAEMRLRRALRKAGR